MEAYCLKCRAKREMKDPKPVTFKNGKNAMQGVCVVCGTKMNKIGGAAAEAATTTKAPAAKATAATAAKATKAPARSGSKK